MDKYAYVSEYEDLVLGADSIMLGAEVEVKTEDGSQMMPIVHKISRNANVVRYDHMTEREIINSCPVDFDVSGEFVTDTDIVYVFLRKQV